MSESREISKFFELDDESVLKKNTNESLPKFLNTSSMNVSNKKSILTPEGTHYSVSSKYDCCVFVIFCPKHDNVALSKHQNVAAYWLPFTQLPNNKSWNDGGLVGSLIVLTGGNVENFLMLKKQPPFSEFKCLNLLRIQLPQSFKFLTRLVYYVEIKTKDNIFSEFKCCVNSERIEWIPLNQVINEKVHFFWGPEVVFFCHSIKHLSFNQTVSEYSLKTAFKHFPRGHADSVFNSVKITEKDIERLYSDYLDHCFPSLYLSDESFKYYMKRYEIEQNDARLSQLFNAFDYNEVGHLSFHELLNGLILMEQTCTHGKLRTKLIFRYYNISRTGQLSRNEFNKLITDIKENESSQNIECWNSVKNKAEEFISFDLFYSAIKEHKLRGTSSLCRNSKPVFMHILRVVAGKTVKTIPKTILNSIIVNRNYKGVCSSCKEINYVLSPYCALINSKGYFSAAQKIFDFKKESNNKDLIFEKKSIPNIVIKMIQDFQIYQRKQVKKVGFLSDQPHYLYRLLEELTNELIIILKNELKCKKIASPCFIIGDIHGNIEDLISLEKSLWRRLPCLSSNYLFLGDYVDRGRFGLECTMYLFAMKVLAPSNVTLLRGNHEIRQTQLRYTYKRECFLKYGDTIGKKIWDLTNKMFNLLPICAVIDDRIYCAHGGIPKSAIKIDEISQLPQTIADPQVESEIAWEILWSDPRHQQQFNDCLEWDTRSTSKDIERGFIFNKQRGTAFYFSEMAVDNFLSQNNLSYIIRAHEVPPSGYTFHFINKCCTVFSCSHYCGNNNDCACILVSNNQTLRLIHIDTYDNSSATE